MSLIWFALFQFLERSFDNVKNFEEKEEKKNVEEIKGSRNYSQFV